MLALVVGTAGCTATPPAPPRPWPGDAQLIQDRTSRGAGTIGVQLTPQEDVIVRGVRVSAGAGTVRWSGDTAIAAGRTVILRMPVPAAACPPSAQARARAVIDLQAPSGTRTVTATLGDPYDALPRLAAEGCTARALRRIATVRVAAVDLEGRGTSVTATIVVTVRPRAGRGRLVLGRVQPTVLIRPPADLAQQWEPDLEVRAGGAPVELRLPVEPARCDAHAIAEDKIGTVVNAFVRVNGEPGEFAIPPVDGIRDTLLNFVAERCGLIG